jgi:lipopolysaccharide transport system permease protein
VGPLRLVRLFVRQDLTQRYAGNVIGLAWAALGPLLQLALFALVFVHIFKARVPGLEGNGYVAFLALGMWPWFAFAEGVSRAAGALTEQAGLLAKVAVPPFVLIVARASTPFLLHLGGFVLVLGALPLLGVTLDWRWLPLAFVAWLPMYGLALGVGTLAAMTQVFVRDLGQLLGYLLSAWLFLSPILYPREMAPPALAPWYSINPVAGWVENIREPLLFGRLSPLPGLAALLGTAAVALLATIVYRRLRPHVEDFL